MLDWLYFIFGLLLLLGAGDLLLRGAIGIAKSFGVSSLVIGLTILAVGTSAPEFFIGAKAALQGSGDIAFSNVVGSNIFNLLCVLGLSALLLPISVEKELFKRDLPIMLGISALLLIWMSALGSVGAIAGGTLVLGFVTYLFVCLKKGLSDGNGAESSSPDAKSKGASLSLSVILLILGSLGLHWGSTVFLIGVQALAIGWGIDERLIGLSLVAIGTSIPELVTSVLAIIKGQRDLAVGNVIGSNIVNILGVLGLSAIVAPEGIQVAREAITTDLPFLLAITLLSWPLLRSAYTLSRLEGVFMLALYFGYMLWIF